MISQIGAIILLIIYVASATCDPTLSGMSFGSPYIFYIDSYYWHVTDIWHSVAKGNECGCGTIEYVWS
jgi:hypothetical protein